MVIELLFPLRRCHTCVFDTRHPSKARCVVVATTTKKVAALTPYPIVYKIVENGMIFSVT